MLWRVLLIAAAFVALALSVTLSVCPECRTRRAWASAARSIGLGGPADICR